MIDLKLNTIEHDVAIERFDLQLVSGMDQISQSLRIRMMLFRGEWFLDVGEGVPFFSDIFVKNPNMGVVEAALKARIKGTPGVTELISFSVDFDKGNRSLVVSFEANTAFGTIQITETI